MKCSVMLLLVVVGVARCKKEEPVAAAPVAVKDTAKEEREALFGEAASTPGIEWRSSGLGVRIIKPGEGTAPKMSDTVRVHYTGHTKDGMVFDDSRARGKPEDFVVSRLLRGWAAGMTALKPGGHAEFFIPPSLGYGNMKVAGIPPQSGLIFDVELVAVNPEGN